MIILLILAIGMIAVQKSLGTSSDSASMNVQAAPKIYCAKTGGHYSLVNAATLLYGFCGSQPSGNTWTISLRAPWSILPDNPRSHPDQLGESWTTASAVGSIGCS